MILQSHKAPVFSVAFASDGTRIASRCSAGTICLWEVSSGVNIVTLGGWTYAFSTDGTRIAIWSSDGSIQVWDSASKETLKHITRSAWNVRSIVFSPDDKCIATATFNRREEGASRAGLCALQIWDVSSGAQLQSIEWHLGSPAMWMPFSQELSGLGTEHNATRLWSESTGQPECL